MKGLLAAANRMMPLVFLVMALVVIAQFAMQHGPSGSALVHSVQQSAGFLGRHALAIAAAAVCFWFLVFVGYFYEAQGPSRTRVVPGSVLMDVLDRLTNRQNLEQKLAKEPDAVIIDSAQLAQALKGHVIGQDAVCDDLAAQIRRRLALK
jgi:hypothetical protein